MCPWERERGHTLDSRFIKTAAFVDSLARLSCTSVTANMEKRNLAKRNINQKSFKYKKKNKKMQNKPCPGVAIESNSLAAISTSSDPNSLAYIQK